MSKDWSGNGNSIWKTLGASNHADAEREADDYYATDPIAIDKLLEVEKPRRFIWECACGGGHLSERLTERGYDVFNSDIKNRGYAKQHLVLDFLKQEGKLFSFEHDILTNPPYKYATEFVLKALELLHGGCKCYMFLKLTFLEGKRRYIELFRDTPPAAFTSFPSAFYAPKTQSLTVCGRVAVPPSRMRGLCGKRAMRAQQRYGGYRRTT